MAGAQGEDKLHRLVPGKYLKQLLKIHEQEKTIDISVDQLVLLRGRCPLPEVCRQWKKVGALTCFCLESVLGKV